MVARPCGGRRRAAPATCARVVCSRSFMRTRSNADDFQQRRIEPQGKARPDVETGVWKLEARLPYRIRLTSMATPICVATWNLWWRHGPWQLRQDAILHELRRTNPDLCCLQEVWSESGTNLAQLLADDLGLECVFYPSA